MKQEVPTLLLKEAKCHRCYDKKKLFSDFYSQMFVFQAKPSTVEILEGIDKVC